MADDLLRSEILAVLERHDYLVSLSIGYEEGDSAGGVGQLFATPSLRASRVGNPTQLLSTNDTLRCLWVSPSGAIWVASADGNVGTTAKIAWPPPRRPDLAFTGAGDAPNWSVTSLPVVKSKGIPPNITALWGTSDSDVHVGTYGGHLYHWDGKSWNQIFDGPGSGNGTTRAFGGPSPTDVYAVGQNDTLLHFDGLRWSPMRIPGVPAANIHFNAVLNLPTGDVLISGTGDEGILLQGNSAQGFTELGHYSLSLIDMAGADGRVLFATGEGVAELFGKDVRTIKSTFKTTTVTAGKKRWFFIEPAPPRPCFVEYDPQYVDSPWRRYKY